MDYNAIALIVSVFLTTSNTESTEEDHHSYAPSTAHFGNFYTNRVADDTNNSSTIEEDVRTSKDPSVLKPSRATSSPISLDSPYATGEAFTTTETYSDEVTESIQVIPIRDQRRGILDMLFPAPRVKTFKSVFDSVRRLLSYTFRRR